MKLIKGVLSFIILFNILFILVFYLEHIENIPPYFGNFSVLNWAEITINIFIGAVVWIAGMNYILDRYALEHPCAEWSKVAAS